MIDPPPPMRLYSSLDMESGFAVLIGRGGGRRGAVGEGRERMSRTSDISVSLNRNGRR